MAEPLAPEINSLSQPFWDAAREDRLLLPRCVATGRLYWPPSPTSPFVTAGQVEWRELEPVGTLLSTVTYRRAFQQRFADRLPYGIALVQLAGVRLQAHVPDPDRAPAAGARVRLGFRALADDAPPVLHLIGAA